MFKVEGVTHWSIPVNDLDESERFYRDVLGLEAKGHLGNSRVAVFQVGGHSILLWQRKERLVRTKEQDNGIHHAFTVSPEMFVRGCKLFHEKRVPVDKLIYRDHGFFTGRELYFFDPNGNMLELRDPTWKPGMPMPTFDEIVRA